MSAGTDNGELVIHFGRYVQNHHGRHVGANIFCGSDKPDDEWMDEWHHQVYPVNCPDCLKFHEDLLRTRYRPGPVAR